MPAVAAQAGLRLTCIPVPDLWLQFYRGISLHLRSCNRSGGRGQRGENRCSCEWHIASSRYVTEYACYGVVTDNGTSALYRYEYRLNSGRETGTWGGAHCCCPQTSHNMKSAFMAFFYLISYVLRSSTKNAYDSRIRLSHTRNMYSPKARLSPSWQPYEYYYDVVDLA